LIGQRSTDPIEPIHRAMSSPSQKSADQWNRQLRYFRFNFAHGGHANDMDMLSADIHFAPSEAGLLDVFARLGIELQRIPASMPRREAGRPYNSDEWDKYADPIRAYPAFARPAFVSIEGMPAHLSVSADRIGIAISGARGDHWVIDGKDFRNALALETLLPQRDIRFVQIASREQTELLFHALQARGLTDLRTHATVRAELLAKGTLSAGARDPSLASYVDLRRQLGAGFEADEVWNNAHDEIFSLVQSALHYDANPHYVAHRCPGFAQEVIDRVCADVRFASR
jgi:hypothetical protein